MSDLSLPVLPTVLLGTTLSPEGKHRFSIERLPDRDMMIVQRDHGPRIEIPLKVLAQGKTIAEAYEELSGG